MSRIIAPLLLLAAAFTNPLHATGVSPHPEPLDVKAIPNAVKPPKIKLPTIRVPSSLRSNPFTTQPAGRMRRLSIPLFSPLPTKASRATFEEKSPAERKADYQQSRTLRPKSFCSQHFGTKHPDNAKNGDPNTLNTVSIGRSSVNCLRASWGHRIVDTPYVLAALFPRVSATRTNDMTSFITMASIIVFGRPLASFPLKLADPALLIGRCVEYMDELSEYISRVSDVSAERIYGGVFVQGVVKQARDTCATIDLEEKRDDKLALARAVQVRIAVAVSYVLIMTSHAQEVIDYSSFSKHLGMYRALVELFAAGDKAAFRAWLDAIRTDPLITAGASSSVPSTTAGDTRQTLKRYLGILNGRFKRGRAADIINHYVATTVAAALTRYMRVEPANTNQ